MARFTSTAPARVDVRAIEREVQRLWREVSERPEAVLGEGVAAPVTRICTLTLLAVASTERTALRMTDVIGHLVAQHPCRSILLRLRDAAEDRLEASIALHCGRGAPGRAPVCCEQITVEAAGRALARVPGLIFPLLVPDLPVYVWWPEEVPSGGGPSGDVLRRLIEVADALVVDSGTLAEPVEALAGLAALARPLPRGLRDLTWGRLTPWRDLLAQTFDPEPMAAALDRVDQVHIVSSGPAGTQPVGGLLLLGWLGSRLGWEPEGPAVRTGDQVEGRCRRGGPRPSGRRLRPGDLRGARGGRPGSPGGSAVEVLRRAALRPGGGAHGAGPSAGPHHGVRELRRGGAPGPRDRPRRPRPGVCRLAPVGLPPGPW